MKGIHGKQAKTMQGSGAHVGLNPVLVSLSGVVMKSNICTYSNMWNSYLWAIIALLFLTGCSTVGISRPVPAQGVAPFDQALMAYARGELEQAEDVLTQVDTSEVRDLRAQALLDSIHRELGMTPDDKDILFEGFEPAEFTPMSPEKLLQIVEYQNPEIRQALYHVIAARAQLREANVSFSPEFSVLTRFIPTGIFLRLTQSLIDGIVKRAERMSQAEESLIAAIAQYGAVQSRVLRQAASEYVRLLQAERVIQLKVAALKLAQESARVASLLADNGLTPSRDMLNIRDQVLSLREEIATLKSQKAVAQYALNSLMGQKGASAAVYEHKSLVVETPHQINEVLQAVNDQHPQLVQSLANIKEARATKREWLWSLPRVDLQGSYGAAGSRRRGGFFQGFTLGARISSPILIWPLQKARSDREQAFIEALEMEWSRLQGEITVNVVTSYEDLRRAQATLEWIRSEKLVRQQELHVLQDQERLGKHGDRLSLLQANLDFLKIVEQEAMQVFAIQQATLDLRYNTGVTLQGIEFQSIEETSDTQTLTPVGSTALLDKAMWVWHPSFLEDREQTKFFLDFAHARNIRTVFLSVSKKRLLHNPNLYKRFILQAHQQGLFVQALNGDPSWVLPERRHAAQEFVQGVLQYNQKSHEAVFDAIHLDVEPYTLPEWKSQDGSVLMTQYIEFLEWAHEMVQPMKLPLVIDIPFWFDETPYDTGTLLEAVWSHVDEVAVMAYQDHPNKIREVIQQEVVMTKKIPKRMWIGVSADSHHIPVEKSDDGNTEDQWTALVEQIDTQLTEDLGTIGLAVHDYDRYQELLLSEALVKL